MTAYERGYGLGAQVRQAYSNEARVYALEAALNQLLIVTENSSGATAALLLQRHKPRLRRNQGQNRDGLHDSVGDSRVRA